MRNELELGAWVEMASTGNEPEVNTKLKSLEIQLNKLAERLSRAEGLGLPSPPPSDTTDFAAGPTSWPLVSIGSQVGSPRDSAPSSYPATYHTSEDSVDDFEYTPSSPLSSGRHFTISQRRKAVEASLWDQFISNVDPLLKLVHIPSARCLFAATTPELAADAEALKSAICYAAAASLQNEANIASTCPSAETLLGVFANDVQSWLSKSKFLTSPTITSLQALALFLICGRRHLEPEYVWSLTANLVRLAMKLNLHKDPDAQGLTFLECEYRRRLWWHICTLDTYTAEFHDTDPLIYERQCTTRFPLAFQDDAASSAISSMSTEAYHRTHAPDMFYCMIRFEITYYARTVLYSDIFTEDNGYPVLSPEGKLSITESLEKTLEEKYYRRCTCKTPTICLLAITTSKMLVAALKLKALLPNLSKVTAGTEHAIVACIKILEASRPLRSDSIHSRWTWLGLDETEWEAATICLSCINSAGSTRARQSVLNRAWLAIDSFTSAWENSIRNATAQRKQQWTQIQELQARAQKSSSMSQPLARQRQLNRRRTNTTSTPSLPNFARLERRVSSTPQSPVTSESSASTSTNSTADEYVAYSAGLKIPTDIKALGLML